MGFQRAWKVTSAVTMVLAVTCVPPPLAVVHQPAKVCPVLAAIGSVPTAVPLFTLIVVGLTVPP